MFHEDNCDQLGDLGPRRVLQQSWVTSDAFCNLVVSKLREVHERDCLSHVPIRCHCRASVGNSSLRSGIIVVVSSEVNYLHLVYNHWLDSEYLHCAVLFLILFSLPNATSVTAISPHQNLPICSLDVASFCVLSSVQLIDWEAPRHKGITNGNHQTDVLKCP